MATQGVVSLMVGGRVRIKAVAGCNGMYASDLARAIRTEALSTLDDVYNAALKTPFGCPGCLVVMDDNAAVRFRDLDEEPLEPLYAEKFSDPRFNPRWKNGTAAYVEIVES